MTPWVHFTLYYPTSFFGIPLCSSFRVTDLDDVTLGGSVASLCNDMSTLKHAEDIGLFLNPLKSEVITNCSDAIVSIHLVLPGAAVVPSDSLGSPIGNSSTFSSTIDQKVSALKLMGERLSFFSLHDSMLYTVLLLLFHPSSHVHPLYFPIVSCGEYDGVICSLLSSLLNVAIDPSSPSWSQASLPVQLGGLGFCSAVQLAPSCYLSLAAASRGLITLILSNTTATYTSRFRDEALARWSDPFPSLTPLWMVGRQSRENGTTFRLKQPLTTFSTRPQMMVLVLDYWQFLLLSQVHGFIGTPT